MNFGIVCNALVYGRNSDVESMVVMTGFRGTESHKSKRLMIVMASSMALQESKRWDNEMRSGRLWVWWCLGPWREKTSKAMRSIGVA